MNERMKLLEAVVAAADSLDVAISCGDKLLEWRHRKLKAALRAYRTFLALPAQPQGETVGKVVQIAAIGANNGVAACVFALRDDGSIWGKRVDRDGAKWWREDDIPATVTLEVTP